ncbi:receptor expression-enhancing protein 4 [Eurytemora carolleeae]|uniref:receptor expression-enhancing protein 4 n=1 Tax=Eurytemora carolleeae TaxID=1294199 RepID=UPI000C78DD90|nr:receptor expression-enhancing protein 4 [Eurytemora carolleeae]|eukprot:XP_023335427.1 receptor expression-enhancing protein 4-like [Eurytemora affinis]
MSVLVYSCTKLVAGTLYPAYGSFKAVKERNVKEYVKWMTYWIVYSLYSLVEEFTDILIAWVPFYYTLKICLIFWLVSPTTRGASVLYI